MAFFSLDFGFLKKPNVFLSNLEIKQGRCGLDGFNMCRGGTVDILDVEDGAAMLEEKRKTTEHVCACGDGGHEVIVVREKEASDRASWRQMIRCGDA